MGKILTARATEVTSIQEEGASDLISGWRMIKAHRNRIIKDRDFCFFGFVCSCFIHIYISKPRNNTEYYLQCIFVKWINGLLDFSHFQIVSYSPILLFSNTAIWFISFRMTAIPPHSSIKLRLSLSFIFFSFYEFDSPCKYAIYFHFTTFSFIPSLEVVEETLTLNFILFLMLKLPASAISLFKILFGFPSSSPLSLLLLYPLPTTSSLLTGQSVFICSPLMFYITLD